MTKFVSEKQWKDTNVLDLGSGCGAASIMALIRGAKTVWANDIDPWCSVALKENAEMSAQLLSTSDPIREALLDPLRLIATEMDLLSVSSGELLKALGTESMPDIILVGDMFYDSSIADLVLSFLARAKEAGTKEIYVADPGRWAFPKTPRLSEIARYPISSLPQSAAMHKENDSFEFVRVFEFR